MSIHNYELPKVPKDILENPEAVVSVLKDSFVSDLAHEMANALEDMTNPEVKDALSKVKPREAYTLMMGFVTMLLALGMITIKQPSKKGE